MNMGTSHDPGDEDRPVMPNADIPQTVAPPVDTTDTDPGDEDRRPIDEPDKWSPRLARCIDLRLRVHALLDAVPMNSTAIARANADADAAYASLNGIEASMYIEWAFGVAGRKRTEAWS